MKVLASIENDNDVVNKKYVDENDELINAKAERMIISSAQISKTQPSSQVANDVWLEVLN